jgi:putative aldouronate transport system substrate-binding protein
MYMKKSMSLLLAGMMFMGMAVTVSAESSEPLKITLYYNDNPTYPFQDDWLAVTSIEEKYNVELDFEPIPMGDYATKVTNVLTTQGDDTPDIILGSNTKAGNASLALNGAVYPVSDHPDWTPNFNERAAEFGLESDVEKLKLSDGNLYYLPALFDIPFYDGGLILRQDYLEEKGFDAPKNFDDFYEILKAYKEDYPDSFPLTTIYNAGFLERMSMPSWGLSLGQANSTATNVLSWDYENKEYFAGAISEQYKDYVTFLHKLYEEGLLDPEMTQDDASTTQKLATGASMATYGFYDQIGGWEEASEIEGFDLNMYPPLEGPAGAHHMPKASVASGILFPMKTSQREDFEEVVRKVDEIFFSKEAALIWCLGIEGETYTMDGDRIVFSDDILNAPEGIYKYMQNAYGCGGLTQTVWVNTREMIKYDENYAALNAEVAAMDDAIQYTPVVPNFDDLTAEDASMMQTTLGDAFSVWDDAFVRGTKDIEADWDAYVEEMKDKGIDEFLSLYNEYNKYR